jgi:hypothetical protein
MVKVSPVVAFLASIGALATRCATLSDSRPKMTPLCVSCENALCETSSNDMTIERERISQSPLLARRNISALKNKVNPFDDTRSTRKRYIKI